MRRTPNEDDVIVISVHFLRRRLCSHIYTRWKRKRCRGPARAPRRWHQTWPDCEPFGPFSDLRAVVPRLQYWLWALGPRTTAGAGTGIGQIWRPIWVNYGSGSAELGPEPAQSGPTSVDVGES